MEECEPIRTLVLSGGSTKGIAMLGGVQCLHDRGLLDHVENFIGTSVGTIIAYLYILGYSGVEIMMFLCKKNFLEKLIQLDMTRLFQGDRAVASFHGVQEFLEMRTVEKFGQYFTLKQLHEKTGKRFVCTTYNLTHRRVEYLSPERFPDLPCITAIRMSASLPLLFEPFTYMNSVYVDGGVCDDFPLGQIDTTLGPAVAVRVVTDTGHYKAVPDNLFDYISLLVTVFKKNVHDIHADKYADRCVKIFDLHVGSEFNPFRFSLTTTQKFDLFSQGYDTTRAQLKNVP